MTSIEEIRAFLRDLDKLEYTGGSALKTCFDGVAAICAFELKNGRNLENDRTVFDLFIEAEIETAGREPVAMALRTVLALWAQDTPNVFAAAINLGRRVGQYESDAQWKRDTLRAKKKSVRNAVKGRKLLGTKSRERIRLAAESFRHLSRESAATEIALLVNMSPGTVRRYLSQLFPGTLWAPSID